MIKSKVYLAGPIRGVSNYKERFEKMHKAYEERGVAVLDPSTLPEGMTQADYMRICIAMLQSADFVQLLPEWENSEGAKIEMVYADMIGLNVYFPINWEEDDNNGQV